MKNIDNATRNIGELNVALNTTFDTRYWCFIFKKIGYNEVLFDADKGTVTYPEFIPLEDMIRDVLEELDRDQTLVCIACDQVFDMNEEEGIFGDLENLDRFLCRNCSEGISAREFYFKYLKA